MNEVESSMTTADELVSVARAYGHDLKPLCHQGTFGDDQRNIFLWRTNGLIQYNLQGKVNTLPTSFQHSASAFRGTYNETGAFETIEEALEFIKAWLLDRKEVDELPERAIRSHGIG